MSGFDGRLQVALALAVPLRMQELADDIRHRGWVEDLAPIVADGLRAPWVDELLYGGPHVVPAYTAAVHGLAALALQVEGGVTFAGLHWCARPHDDQDGRPCRPVRVGDLPPWPQTPPARGLETVTVVGGQL